MLKAAWFALLAIAIHSAHAYYSRHNSYNNPNNEVLLGDLIYSITESPKSKSHHHKKKKSTHGNIIEKGIKDVEALFKGKKHHKKKTSTQNSASTAATATTTTADTSTESTTAPSSRKKHHKKKGLNMKSLFHKKHHKKQSEEQSQGQHRGSGIFSMENDKLRLAARFVIPPSTNNNTTRASPIIVDLSGDSEQECKCACTL
jgi:hypothetical protein